jgi:hypothetical protein
MLSEHELWSLVMVAGTAPVLEPRAGADDRDEVRCIDPRQHDCAASISL